MKINKKLVVSALALCMGAGLAGSITGTIAWYQYSTKSTVSMLSTSVGVRRNMQIKIGNFADTEDTNYWKSDLKMDDIAAYLTHTGDYDDGLSDDETLNNKYSQGDLSPVTTGAVGKDENISLYNPPMYQRPEPSKWGAAFESSYVVLPLHIRCVETTGTAGAEVDSYVAKDIYLEDITIANANTDTTHKDISDSIRVHLTGSNGGTPVYALAGNVSSTNTYGTLDLNNDGEVDSTARYDWEKENANDIYYGFEEQPEDIEELDEEDLPIQETYNLLEEYGDGIFANNDVDPTNITSGLKLGTTQVGISTGISVTAIIFLEGWQLFGDDEMSAVWSVADYIGSKVHIGMTFTCNAD